MLNTSIFFYMYAQMLSLNIVDFEWSTCICQVHLVEPLDGLWEAYGRNPSLPFTDFWCASKEQEDEEFHDLLGSRVAPVMVDGEEADWYPLLLPAQRHGKNYYDWRAQREIGPGKYVFVFDQNPSR